MNIQIFDDPPPVADYIEARAREGWGEFAPAAARRALEASLLHATARADNTLIGFGRVVGDGIVNFYIQDVITRPGFRGLGVGSAIISRLMSKITTMAEPGASVGLMSAVGREGFYNRFGFQTRPSPRFGAGMIALL